MQLFGLYFTLVAALRKKGNPEQFVYTHDCFNLDCSIPISFISDNHRCHPLTDFQPSSGIKYWRGGDTIPFHGIIYLYF